MMTKQEKLLWLAQTWILSHQADTRKRFPGSSNDQTALAAVSFLLPLLSVKDGAIPQDMSFALHQYIGWMRDGAGHSDNKPSWWQYEG